MRYLSIDLETTCLSPAKPENILMLSAIVEDTKSNIPLEELPHFTCFFNPSPIMGEAYALGLNGWILDIISGRADNTKGYPIYDIDSNDFYLDIIKFINEHFDSKITVAGKNAAGFDIPFLPEWLSKNFRHRVLDPGSMFVDIYKDEVIPDLATIKKRCGLEDVVTHDAYDDALDVIRILRSKK